MSDEQDTNMQPKRRRKKPLSPHYKADNKGGFGNPPVKGQFPKNCKPGPGRTKGDTSFAAEMRRMIKSPVPLKNGGSTSYMSALALAARDSSLKKTPRSTEFGIRMVEKFGPPAEMPKEEAPDFDGFNDAEIAIVEALLSRAVHAPPPESLSNPLGTRLETGEGYFRIRKGLDGHLHVERVGDLNDDDVASS